MTYCTVAKQILTHLDQIIPSIRERARQWLLPVIPALGSLKQEDFHEFDASLDYTLTLFKNQLINK